MSDSPWNAREGLDINGLPRAPFGADAVYFLMWPGWERELRSNRWHYATRWARLLPVVLLQPVQHVAVPESVACAEARIANCRILEIAVTGGPRSYIHDSLVQVGQVRADMAAQGIARPLLWCYNPALVGLYAALPAAGRVFHATENYFHFEGMPSFFLDCQRATVAISDVTVAVSDGVAASIRENVPESRIEVVTNGCDYIEYSRYRPDPRLLDVKRGRRLAIYAGNLNSRLDFGLIERCVRAHREITFAFFGPVTGLTMNDAVRWKGLLLEPNVHYGGAVSPDDLPGLYGAADVGFIPYRQTRLLLENGFPLKALEMCATGLPVVSTWMKPLEGLMDALSVVRDHDSFVERLVATSRAGLGDREKLEMERVCKGHDYDNKFASVLQVLRQHGDDRGVTTRLDDLLPRVLADHWRNFTDTAWRGNVRPACEPPTQATGSGASRRALFVRRELKAFLALWLTWTDRSLRNIWVEWLRATCARRGPAETVGAGALLQDLLRLGALRREIARSRSGESWLTVKSEYDPQRQRVVIRSATVEETFEAKTVTVEAGERSHVNDGGRAPLREIVWWHSEPLVPCPVGRTRVWVFLGHECRYEFRALALFARRHPQAVWNALDRLPDHSATAMPR